LANTLTLACRHHGPEVRRSYQVAATTTVAFARRDERRVRAALRHLSFPTAPQGLLLHVPRKHSGAAFPVNRFRFPVPQFKRVAHGHGVDPLMSSFKVARGHVDPRVFEDVGQLAKELVDVFESRRKQRMNAILDRTPAPKIQDVNNIIDLSNPLDTTLALL
jgi:hypothetical protein